MANYGFKKSQVVKGSWKTDRNKKGKGEQKKTLDFGFVKEGGALKNPLDNTGEFYLLPL